MRYAVVIETTDNNFSAFVPDLPGCIATAESEEDVRRLIRDAVEFHLDAMRQDGSPIPEPRTRVLYVDTAEAA